MAKTVLVAVASPRFREVQGGLRIGKSRWQRLALNQYLRDHPTATVIYATRDGWRIEKHVGECLRFVSPK